MRHHSSSELMTKPEQRPAGGFASPRACPVLIRVPRVREARRPSASARGRLPSHGPATLGGVGNGSRTNRPRRRLRREVRLAAWALLTLFPLCGAALFLRGAVPARNPAAPVSITIGPPAASWEVTAPVVFPGYLLPDDGAEEPRHAGG